MVADPELTGRLAALRGLGEPRGEHFVQVLGVAGNQELVGIDLAVANVQRDVAKLAAI
jgi:hypothetical protein